MDCLEVVPSALNAVYLIDLSLFDVEDDEVEAVEVLDDDTPEVLQKRVMEQAEWVILPKAIALIANGKVSVEDGHVIIAKE